MTAYERERAERYAVELCSDDRIRIADKVGGDYVRTAKRNVRRFATLESAGRVADALNRGVRRPAGTRE